MSEHTGPRPDQNEALRRQQVTQRVAYAQSGVLIDHASPLMELADKAEKEAMAAIKAGILPMLPILPMEPSAPQPARIYDLATPTNELVEQILGDLMPEQLALEEMEREANRADLDKRN